MKWSSSLSALLASTAALVLASPVASRELKLFNLKIVSPIDSNINSRYLTINPDGSLGVFSDRTANTGSIPPRIPVPPTEDTTSSKPSSPGGAKFYVTQAGPTGSADARHYELHSYPIGIVDHVLGLNGTAKDGIRYLVDVTNPGHNATAGSDGSNSPDYKSFTLDNYGSNVDANGDDGRAENDIEIEINLAKRIPPPLPLNGFYYGANGHGKWALIQRGANTFVAAWYDGSSHVTENYRLVDITYEPADA